MQDDRLKKKFIIVRVTPAERAAVEALAHRTGKKLSAAVRELLAAASAKPGAPAR